jgi:hypothetical protein
VFQYLGTIDRPAEIGFRTASGQVLFDFRSGRARIDGGRWLAPEALNAAEAVRWRELVTTWERMLVSRRGESPRG